MAMPYKVAPALMMKSLIIRHGTGGRMARRALLSRQEVPGGAASAGQYLRL